MLIIFMLAIVLKTKPILAAPNEVYDGYVFDSEFEDTAAVETRNITLTCRVLWDQSVPIMARWIWNSGSLGFKHNHTSFPDSRFSWANDFNYNIKISHLLKTDSGKYICQVFPQNYDEIRGSSGADGSIKNRTITLWVLQIPTSEKQIQTKVSHGHDVGKVVHLYNEAALSSSEPNKTVIWMDKEFNVLFINEQKVIGQPVIARSKVHVESGNGSTLVIGPLRTTDAQMFYSVYLPKGSKPEWQQTAVNVFGCPRGWEHFGDIKKCYGGPTYWRSFGGAEVWCRQKAMHVAMPKSQKEVDAITNGPLRKHSSGWLWIGLDTFSGHWMWSDGEALLEKQQRWRQPPDPNKSYAAMNGGIFWEASYLSKYPFICESSDSDWFNKNLEKTRCPEGWIYFVCGGYCYLRIYSVKGSEAYRKCEFAAPYATIAMPKTKREHMFVRHMSLPHNKAWIGIKRSRFNNASLHEWADGRVESWIWWSSLNDYKSDNSKRCLSMTYKGKISSHPCSEYRDVVCQTIQKDIKLLNPSACKSKTREKRAVIVDGMLHSFTEVNDINQSHTSVKKILKKRQAQHDPQVSQGLNLGALAGSERNDIDIENFPWLARIIVIQSCNCNGALIGPWHVLTTASCLYTPDLTKPVPRTSLKVALGSTDKYYFSGPKHYVHSVTIHPKFKLNVDNSTGKVSVSDYKYDIAIIELETYQHSCAKIRPVSLPSTIRSNYDDFNCIVVGSGSDENCIDEKPTESAMFCHVNQSSERITPSAITGSYVSADKNLVYKKNTNCSPHYDERQLRDFANDAGAPMVCKPNHTTPWGIDTIYCMSFLTGILQGVKNNQVIYSKVDNFVRWIQWTMHANTHLFRYTQTACEGQTFDINCHGGSGRPWTIKIVKARYGSWRRDLCVDLNKKQDDCGCENNVLANMMIRCGGRTSCSLDVKSELFPEVNCGGYCDALEVSYMCIPGPARSILCEGQRNFQELQCPLDSGRIIQVQSANWGKTNKVFCQGPENPSCKGIDVTKKIANRCNGLNYCYYELHNLSTHFSETNPCPGYTKYLETVFDCVPGCPRIASTEYMGPVSTTVNGVTCQKWSAITPHKILSFVRLYQQNFPEKMVPDNNHCRDPDKKGVPWCYTTDPSKQWDYCFSKRCNFGFKTFEFLSEDRSYFQAKAICAANGMTLPEPNDVASNKLLADYFITNELVYLGMTKSSTGWRWDSDDSLVDYFPWQTDWEYLNEPTHPDDKKCAVQLGKFGTDHDGQSEKWADVNCKGRHNSTKVTCQDVTGPPCPLGFTRVDTRCFYLGRSLTYQQALDMCTTMNSTLAHVHTEIENRAVASFIAGKSHREVWLGANDIEQEGRWLWTGSLESLSYTNWTKGNPSNSDGVEDCLTISPYHNNIGGWKSQTCDSPKDYICYKPAAHHVYKLRYINERGNWETARRKCEEFGGELPEPRSYEKNRKFIDLIDSLDLTTGVWMGSRWQTSSDSWTWESDGEYLSYQDWVEDYENAHTDDRLCMQYWLGHRGWDDTFCSQQNEIICQFSPDYNYLLCNNGFTLIGDYCYQLQNVHKSRTDASSHCQQLASTLAQPKSEEENQAVLKMSNSDPKWVHLGGVRDHGQWKWETKSEPMVYTRWLNDGPTDTHDNNCLYMITQKAQKGGWLPKAEGGEWYSLPCYNRRFVCQHPRKDVSQWRRTVSLSSGRSLPPVTVCVLVTGALLSLMSQLQSVCL